ncbi:MAG TPA: transketolase C-terminal domain-containing protein [Gemmataceae bacterium]|nr:transketolase C-terminal domain-containing protein [Gemmataceae bacterium]
MRNAFADEITALAGADERIVLLSGDIGNRLFDKFKDLYPRRFINCGVAEANMITLAAGLALSGLRPVAYTIASFVTYRCMEQIRDDLCYHHVPVVVVGTGAGLSYAANGPTHHTGEEIGMLRLLPGMTIVCPGDALEARAALRATLQQPGPCYLRLGKKGEPVIHKSIPDLQIGKALCIRPGKDLALLSTGNMLPTAMKTADLLSKQGMAPEVISFHTVKPLDEEYLKQAFERFPVVATIEEHSRLGGLGGALAEWLADQKPQRGRLVRFGMDDRFLHEAGEQEHARECYGLTAAKIAEILVAE